VVLVGTWHLSRPNQNNNHPSKPFPLHNQVLSFKVRNTQLNSPLYSEQQVGNKTGLMGQVTQVIRPQRCPEYLSIFSLGSHADRYLLALK